MPRGRPRLYPDAASKNAAVRARRKQSGGRWVSVMLSPEAAQELAEWQAFGGTVKQIIEKLLLGEK